MGWTSADRNLAADATEKSKFKNNTTLVVAVELLCHGILGDLSHCCCWWWWSWSMWWLMVVVLCRVLFPETISSWTYNEKNWHFCQSNLTGHHQSWWTLSGGRSTSTHIIGNPLSLTLYACIGYPLLRTEYWNFWDRKWRVTINSSEERRSIGR